MNLAAVTIGVMPWTRTNYPHSMKNLPANVRTKAVEIANALLEEGEDEGRAIRVGIGRAKKWAANPSRSGKKRREGKAPAVKRLRRQPQRGRPERRISKASHITGGGTG